MLMFKDKRDTSLSLVRTDGVDTVNFILYRDTLVVVDANINPDHALSQFRYVIGSIHGKIQDMVSMGIMGNDDIYYRIPGSQHYINRSYNRIELKMLGHFENLYYMIPMVINRNMVEIKLLPKSSKNDTAEYTIGTLSMEMLYNIARHFIHIPKALFTDDAKDAIKKWYSKIRFVKQDDILHPILVGEDVAFARFKNRKDEEVVIGIPPEHPYIIVKKSYLEDVPDIKSGLSEYKVIYKYLEFSPTMPVDSSLNGYYMFTNRIDYSNMLYLPVNTYETASQSRYTRDPIYMIMSALRGGRTEEKFSLSILNDSTNNINWISSDSIYGATSIIKYGSAEYVNRIRRS